MACSYEEAVEVVVDFPELNVRYSHPPQGTGVGGCIASKRPERDGGGEGGEGPRPWGGGFGNGSSITPTSSKQNMLSKSYSLGVLRSCYIFDDVSPRFFLPIPACHSTLNITVNGDFFK